MGSDGFNRIGHTDFFQRTTAFKSRIPDIDEFIRNFNGLESTAAAESAGGNDPQRIGKDNRF